jgi:hypothetical protein
MSDARPSVDAKPPMIASSVSRRCYLAINAARISDVSLTRIGRRWATTHYPASRPLQLGRSSVNPDWPTGAPKRRLGQDNEMTTGHDG